jgi:signal transduction histidine kinase
MEYLRNKLFIRAIDNGKGFEVRNVAENGIGLINMKKRGSLIDAEVTVESEVNKGTSLTITIRNTNLQV